MAISAGPPAMLGLTIAVLAAIRTRSVRIRLPVEGLLLAALGGGFALWGASPLRASVELGQRPDAVWLRALAVIWWLLGARFVASLVVMAMGRNAQTRKARLVSDLMAAAIYLTAALVVLNSVLGLHVKGLLATSGLIAILLGLASQSTLSDVFSGIVVGIDKPFHVGDRVSIGDQEGVIVQMNWRAIRLQTDGEDIAVIPNSTVAKSLIINRSVPTLQRAASVDIPIRSSARSEVLMDLFRQAILLSPTLLAKPDATVVLKYLGARTTTFGVNYFVASSSDLTSARSELLRQIRRLLRHAGLAGEAQPTSNQLLSALRLFESLNPEQIGRLEARVISRQLNSGQSLYSQGDAGASIYVVKSGVLEISRKGEGDDGQPEGAAKAYGRMGPGECLGEISMMSGKPHPVSATALTRCEVLELPRSELELLLDEDAALGEAMDQSVRQEMALLDQAGARPAMPPLDDSSTLLSQIRQFLRRRLAKPGSAGPSS